MLNEGDTPYMSDIRALVGSRVSHVQGEEKTSHISQRGKGEAYAESQNWTVVGAFEDLDVSAIKLSPRDRPDLKKWLTDQADDWDALIFASVFAEIEGQRFVQRARDRNAYLRNTDRWGYGLAPFGFQIVDHPSTEGIVSGDQARQNPTQIRDRAGAQHCADVG